MKDLKINKCEQERNYSCFETRLNAVLKENHKLYKKLRRATDKQHQEMSRAIELMDKNNKIKYKLHEAKEEACELRKLNERLKNLPSNRK